MVDGMSRFSRIVMQRDIEVAVAALTVATGSLDVTAFLRLGGVFASVMTSNLAFVGIAVIRAEGALGAHCAVALAGYIAGVALGSAVAAPGGGEGHLGTRRLNLLLGGELVLLVAYALGWLAADAHPKGWAQMVLLGSVALAMGAQSAAAHRLRHPAAATTYLTGALTGVVTALTARRRPDPAATVALVALVAGAAVGAALIEVVPMATPLLAVTAVAVAVALSGLAPSATRGDAPGQPSSV
jgi:uncharacterized membrane protein YoaK (UPF0700 family)